MMQTELINELAEKFGKTPQELEAILQANPMLAKALGSMSRSDAERLMAVLSDKAAMEKVMSSPQARQIAALLQKGKKD